MTPADRRVLIVDDDDVVVLGLADYLAGHGFTVDASRDFSAAKTLLRQARYAAAVVDILITGHTADLGIEFLRWMRGFSPETQVIVLTAYGTPWLEHVGRQLGIDAFVNKPASLADIARLITTQTSTEESTNDSTKAV